MSALVVIVAPHGPMAEVREVLRDLSAVGLIDPFVWVEPGAPDEPRITAMTVTAGVAEGTTLQAIATSNREERIRLVSLAPILNGGEAIDSSVEQKIADLLENSAGEVKLTRIRAVVTRVGDPTVGTIARAGWHNIMLAPEESSGPALGHALLHATKNSVDIGRHTATALASLAGLWTDVATSVLDDMAIDPGESVRLARSFYRRLQSDELEGTLRGRVTATSEALPLPIEAGQASLAIEDVALATSTMSKAFWARNDEVLRGPREKRPKADITPIGPLKALKMFFGFLWAAIKNAPGAWLAGVTNRLKSGTAAAIHSMVFGGDASAYAVVVGGVTGSGLPASWLDIADAADAIETILEQDGEQREHHAQSDLSKVWREYADAAMTLADAGERVSGLSPVLIGPKRAVLRSPDLAVPNRAQRFTAIPGHIAAQLGVSGVDAFDVLAVNNLHQRLTHLQQDASIGLDVGATLEALKTWNAKVRGSFATRVGSVLGERMVELGNEVKAILERMRQAAAADDMPAAIAAKQKRLALVLRILGIILVVVLLVAGLLFGLGVIELWLALSIGGGALVAWFLASVITFIRGQSALFKLINQREQLVAEAQILKQNLRHALRDVRRLSDAYAQFLAWSRVVGALLAEPLGRSPEVRSDGSRLSPDLPVPLRLGSAKVKDAELDNAVVALRREVFRTGWLSGSWSALIAGAAGALGADGFELRENPQAIFALPGRGDDALLLRWVAIVEDEGLSPEVSDRLWEEVREHLDTDKKELASLLLGSIAELGKPGAAVPYDTFMAGIDDRDGAGAKGRFDREIFTMGDRATAQVEVEKTGGEESRHGLSRVAVLTQLSPGNPAYTFSAYRRELDDDSDSGPVF